MRPWVYIAAIGWALFFVTVWIFLGVIIPHVGKIEGRIDYLVEHEK